MRQRQWSQKTNPHGLDAGFCLPLDFRRPCFGDGSSEVTDFHIFSGARHFHSSPRWKVETVSPQFKVTHSQSLHDDGEADDDDDDGF